MAKAIRRTRSSLKSDITEMVPLSSSSRENGAKDGTEAAGWLSLASLPERVLITVMKCCLPGDVWAMAQTCTAIRAIVHANDSIWRDSLKTICREEHLDASNFPAQSLSPAELVWASQRSIHFTSSLAGEVLSDWTHRLLDTGKTSYINGIALIPGGRWLITRSATTVCCWDLGYGPAPQMKSEPVAEHDLNPSANLDGLMSCDVKKYRVPLILDQISQSLTRLHVPYAPDGVIKSPIIACDLSTGIPQFSQVAVLQSPELSAYPSTFSFKGQFVASELETAITIWNWEEDTWVTFTEDNFFDEPPCPAHTSVELKLVPPYIIVVTGGETKLFEIPKLRPRRPRSKPSFLTIQPIWSVRLPLALDSNPVIGSIFEDALHTSQLLHLILVYDSEALLYRLPPPVSSSKSSSTPVLRNRRRLPYDARSDYTVAGGSTSQLAWTLFPREEELYVLTDSTAPKGLRSLCKLAHSGGPNPRLTACPFSGRIVLLNDSNDPISIFDLRKG